MTAIAVTGASGHLGRFLVPYLWEHGHIVTQVGRDLPALDVDVVMHLAAPRDWRNEEQVRRFARFNEELATRTEHSGIRVISTGSWWQHAGPEAESLSYTRMKADQQRSFGSTLIPFSIYATSIRDGRGFIPQLQSHLRGSHSLAGASVEPRDWIHVRDVASAFLAVMYAPDGVYEARSGVQFSPRDLAEACGVDGLPDYPESPPCSPSYVYPVPPGWAPTVSVLDHLHVRSAA